MPVPANPLNGPDVTSVEGEDQNLLRATMTSVNGRPVLSKRLTIVATQNQVATIHWVLRDRDGNPIDLVTLPLLPGQNAGNFGPGEEEEDPAPLGYIKLKLLESLSLGASSVKTYDAVVHRTTEGEIRCTLDAVATQAPGVFVGEFGVYDPQDQLLFTNVFWFVVEPSLHTEQVCRQGIPSIAEIRLHLRDNHPADNLLLDELDFDLSEIASSIIRPIQYFNETRPPLNRRYTTENFPWRYHWLEAIVGNLFLIAAEHYRRNALPYQAGGMSVDDKNKYTQYMQAGQERQQVWKDWVLHKKAEINASQFFGTHSSPYDRWL